MLVKNIKPSKSGKKKKGSKNKKQTSKKQQVKLGIAFDEQQDFQQQMLRQIQEQNLRKQQQANQKKINNNKKASTLLMPLQIQDISKFEQQVKLKQQQIKIKQEQIKIKHLQRAKQHSEQQMLSKQLMKSQVNSSIYSNRDQQQYQLKQFKIREQIIDQYDRKENDHKQLQVDKQQFQTEQLQQQIQKEQYSHIKKQLAQKLTQQIQDKLISNQQTMTKDQNKQQQQQINREEEQQAQNITEARQSIANQNQIKKLTTTDIDHNNNQNNEPLQDHLSQNNKVINERQQQDIQQHKVANQCQYQQQLQQINKDETQMQLKTNNDRIQLYVNQIKDYQNSNQVPGNERQQHQQQLWQQQTKITTFDCKNDPQTIFIQKSQISGTVQQQQKIQQQNKQYPQEDILVQHAYYEQIVEHAENKQIIEHAENKQTDNQNLQQIVIANQPIQNDFIRNNEQINHQIVENHSQNSANICVNNTADNNIVNCTLYSQIQSNTQYEIQSNNQHNQDQDLLNNNQIQYQHLLAQNVPLVIEEIHSRSLIDGQAQVKDCSNDDLQSFKYNNGNNDILKGVDYQMIDVDNERQQGNQQQLQFQKTTSKNYLCEGLREEQPIKETYPDVIAIAQNNELTIQQTQQQQQQARLNCQQQQPNVDLQKVQSNFMNNIQQTTDINIQRQPKYSQGIHAFEQQISVNIGQHPVNQRTIACENPVTHKQLIANEQPIDSNWQNAYTPKQQITIVNSGFINHHLQKLQPQVQRQLLAQSVIKQQSLNSTDKQAANGNKKLDSKVTKKPLKKSGKINSSKAKTSKTKSTIKMFDNDNLLQIDQDKEEQPIQITHNNVAQNQNNFIQNINHISNTTENNQSMIKQVESLVKNEKEQKQSIKVVQYFQQRIQHQQKIDEQIQEYGINKIPQKFNKCSGHNNKVQTDQEQLKINALSTQTNQNQLLVNMNQSTTVNQQNVPLPLDQKKQSSIGDQQQQSVNTITISNPQIKNNKKTTKSSSGGNTIISDGTKSNKKASNKSKTSSKPNTATAKSKTTNHNNTKSFSLMIEANEDILQEQQVQNRQNRQNQGSNIKNQGINIRTNDDIQQYSVVAKIEYSIQPKIEHNVEQKSCSLEYQQRISSFVQEGMVLEQENDLNQIKKLPILQTQDQSLLLMNPRQQKRQENKISQTKKIYSTQQNILSQKIIDNQHSQPIYKEEQRSMTVQLQQQPVQQPQLEQIMEPETNIKLNLNSNIKPVKKKNTSSSSKIKSSTVGKSLKSKKQSIGNSKNIGFKQKANNSQIFSMVVQEKQDDQFFQFQNKDTRQKHVKVQQLSKNVKQISNQQRYQQQYNQQAISTDKSMLNPYKQQNEQKQQNQKQKEQQYHFDFTKITSANNQLQFTKQHHSHDKIQQIEPKISSLDILSSQLQPTKFTVQLQNTNQHIAQYKQNHNQQFSNQIKLHELRYQQKQQQQPKQLQQTLHNQQITIATNTKSKLKPSPSQSKTALKSKKTTSSKPSSKTGPKTSNKVASKNKKEINLSSLSMLTDQMDILGDQQSGQTMNIKNPKIEQQQQQNVQNHKNNIIQQQIQTQKDQQQINKVNNTHISGLSSQNLSTHINNNDKENISKSQIVYHLKQINQKQQSNFKNLHLYPNQKAQPNIISNQKQQEHKPEEEIQIEQNKHSPQTYDDKQAQQQQPAIQRSNQQIVTLLGINGKKKKAKSTSAASSAASSSKPGGKLNDANKKNKKTTAIKNQNKLTIVASELIEQELNQNITTNQPTVDALLTSEVNDHQNDLKPKLNQQVQESNEKQVDIPESNSIKEQLQVSSAVEQQQKIPITQQMLHLDQPQIIKISKSQQQKIAAMKQEVNIQSPVQKQENKNQKDQDQIEIAQIPKEKLIINQKVKKTQKKGAKQKLKDKSLKPKSKAINFTVSNNQPQQNQYKTAIKNYQSNQVAHKNAQNTDQVRINQPLSSVPLNPFVQQIQSHKVQQNSNKQIAISNLEKNSLKLITSKCNLNQSQSVNKSQILEQNRKVKQSSSAVLSDTLKYQLQLVKLNTENNFSWMREKIMMMKQDLNARIRRKQQRKLLLRQIKQGVQIQHNQHNDEQSKLNSQNIVKKDDQIAKYNNSKVQVAMIQDQIDNKDQDQISQLIYQQNINLKKVIKKTNKKRLH